MWRESSAAPRQRGERDGLGAEVGREVCRRHLYFVKRRACERADIADAGFDMRRRELQSIELQSLACAEISAFLDLLKLSA